MSKEKVKFTKNDKGEIIGMEINEEITLAELIEEYVNEEYVNPEIDEALTRQKLEIRCLIEELKPTKKGASADLVNTFLDSVLLVIDEY